MKNIYHPDPVQRLLAARDFAKSMREPQPLPENWPEFWTGVSNPWLLFLGPSPGNSPDKNFATKALRFPTLGEPHPHIENYNDSTGFWKRIREWTENSFKLAGVFDSSRDAFSSILVGNLISINQGNQEKTFSSELIEEFNSAAKLIKFLQPRLVVTMHKEISCRLLKTLIDGGMKISNKDHFEVPAKNQKRYKMYKPKFWDLISDGYRVRVLESPQSLIKTNFYDSSVVDNFLADNIRIVSQT